MRELKSRITWMFGITCMFQGEGPRKGEKAVVKVFRDAPGTEAMCDAEIAKHAMAQRLCKKFNKKVSEASDKVSQSSHPAPSPFSNSPVQTWDQGLVADSWC